MLNILFVFFLFSKTICCKDNISLNIAVSSNFLLTFNIIAKSFEEKFYCKVNVITDSTGNLYNKLVYKAPFDIFISADKKHPLLIEKIYNMKSYIYGYGKIALFKNNNIIRKKNIFRDIILFKYFVFSNDKLSPYGDASRTIFNNLKLIDENNIICLNIGQVYNLIIGESICIGFIALSQILHNYINISKFILMPSYLYEKIEQRFIFINNDKENICLKYFNIFFNSDYVKNIILRYGYKIK